MAKKGRTGGQPCKYFRKLDKFAHPVTLTLDGEEKITTISGACWTIILYTVGLFYTGQFLLNPQYQAYNDITTNLFNTVVELYEDQSATLISPFQLSPNFAIKISVRDSFGNFVDFPEDFGQFEAQTNGDQIKMGNCTGTDTEVSTFIQLNWQLRFKKITSDKGNTQTQQNCFPFCSDISLQRSFCLQKNLNEVKIDSKSLSNQLSITLKQCNESLKQCQSSNAVFDFLQKHTISIDWIQGTFKKQNLAEFPEAKTQFRVPIDVFYSQQFSAYYDLQTKASLSFKVNKFKASQDSHGIINNTFAQIYSKTFGTISTDNIYALPRNDDKIFIVELKNSDTYLSSEFYVEQLNEVNYLDALSKIGGFATSIVMIVSVLMKINIFEGNFGSLKFKVARRVFLWYSCWLQQQENQILLERPSKSYCVQKEKIPKFDQTLNVQKTTPEYELLKQNLKQNNKPTDIDITNIAKRIDDVIKHNTYQSIQLWKWLYPFCKCLVTCCGCLKKLQRRKRFIHHVKKVEQQMIRKLDKATDQAHIIRQLQKFEVLYNMLINGRQSLLLKFQRKFQADSDDQSATTENYSDFLNEEKQDQKLIHQEAILNRLNEYRNKVLTPLDRKLLKGIYSADWKEFGHKRLKDNILVSDDSDTQKKKNGNLCDQSLCFTRHNAASQTKQLENEQHSHLYLNEISYEPAITQGEEDRQIRVMQLERAQFMPLQAISSSSSFVNLSPTLL